MFFLAYTLLPEKDSAIQIQWTNSVHDLQARKESYLLSSSYIRSAVLTEVKHNKNLHLSLRSADMTE